MESFYGVNKPVYHQDIKSMSALFLMPTNILIHVDCGFFYIQPENICQRRHNFDPSLRPWPPSGEVLHCSGEVLH